MALARFERDFTDEAGNLLTGNISVEVRRETGGLVPVYSDRAGANALGNPFVNSGGAVAFHCVGGAYKITVTQGGFERILRYVGIGTKQEQDQGQDFAGYGMQWESGTTAPPSAGCVRANNTDLSLATKLFVSEVTLSGSDIAARLQELDSTGKSQQNGVILTQQPAGDTVSWKVSTVVDQTGYKEINVNTHAGETTLNVGSISLLRSTTGGDGVDGASMLTRVRVVATTNIAIATALENGDTVDGVALVAGDLVLLTGQTAPAENGVYLVPASGAAARDTSFDTYNEHPGAYFSVMEGTAKADTLWRCTSNKGGTLGVTSLVFAEVTTTVADDSVTNAKLANMAQATIKGRQAAAGTGDPEDLTAAQARTAIGLGTAATENTGTSGATVPLLNASNTFSAPQTFLTAASGGAPVVLQSTSADANPGPILQLDRNSASPAINDILGYVQFAGRSSTGVVREYGGLQMLAAAVTNGAETGAFSFTSSVAGVAGERMRVQSGLQVGAPTGGDKGAGTINASDVYNDNVALTCMALASEFLKNGTVDTDFWDGLVPPQVIPEYRSWKQVTELRWVVEDIDETIHAEPDDPRSRVVEVRRRRVRHKKLFPVIDFTPVYDANGNGLDAIFHPLMEEVVTPEQVIPRRHELAHRFKAMVDDGFDPRDPVQYIMKLKADEALPGMLTKAEWQHGEHSTGELFGRLWLATEMLALVVISLHEQVETMKKRT